jgi:hypothetical protein
MLLNKKASFAALLLASTSVAGVASAADESAKTEESAEPKDEPQEESVWAPNKKEPARMAVAVNPVGLIFGLILAEFDYGLSDTLSLNINAAYWDFSVTTAIGGGVGAQFFLPQIADSGPLYQGFYVYPSLQVLSVEVDGLFLLDDYNYISVAPRVVAGWQWDWRPFTLRVGAGLEYYIASEKNGYDVDLNGLRFAADGTIGLTF